MWIELNQTKLLLGRKIQEEAEYEEEEGIKVLKREILVILNGSVHGPVPLHVCRVLYPYMCTG